MSMYPRPRSGKAPPSLAPVPAMPRSTVNRERANLAIDKELRATVGRMNTGNSLGMTFWSRYDPVSQPRGNTDHWTKMKQRAVQCKSLDSPGTLGVPITLGLKHTRTPYNRVERLQDKKFDDFVLDALQGAVPGNYMYTRPRNAVSRESCRNSFNDRARDGFRYWLIERPKPTSFGKYGIGSFKTVIGIGNAPRT